MNKYLTAVVLLSALLGFGASVQAKENEGLSKADLEQINNVCKQEAKDAENPQWYVEECVADRTHELKVERGLAQPKKEEG